MAEMILPKLWLQRIQRIWDKTVPENYPKTNSEFSLKFNNEDVKSAVILMENNLSTENSIISSDMVPENTILGAYLGTYDVKGIADELTLISPEKVSPSTVGVIAMHYNEEDSTWERIEDAQIIDEYVYGTLKSFSPISVFTIKRDTFVIESDEFFKQKEKLFVANGIPVVITKNEEGNIIVTDANGKETVITEDTIVIGGTIDGSDIESTSVSVLDTSIKSVIAGSYSSKGPVYVQNANVSVSNSTISSGVAGAGFNNRIINFKAIVKNTKAQYIGCGNSISKNKDSNINIDLNLGANTWVKNSCINIENSDIYILYGAGNNGLMYVKNVELNIKGGKYTYVSSAGSNGNTEECLFTIEDAHMDIFETTNRGTVSSAKGTIKNCTGNIAVAGDPSDKTVTGTIGNVKLDISGGKLTLSAGTNSGVLMTPEVAKDIVEYVKISRTSEIDYKDNSDKILEGIIRIK